MRGLRLGLVLLLTALLCACGFHLRGKSSSGADSQGNHSPVRVQQNHSDNVLRRLVNQQLSMQGITRSEATGSQEKIPGLRVSDIGRSDTVLSLDADARTAERLLMLTAKLSLVQSDGAVLESTTLQEQRILFTNPNNPVGNSTEQTLLVSEMEHAMAQRIAEQASRWLDREQADAAASGPAR